MMALLLLTAALFQAVVCLSKSPDTGLGMVEIVAARGYTLDTHGPVTDDGYILGLFRIAESPFLTTTNAVKRGPILLMHGFFDSSYTYVCLNRNESLAYLLSDLGYDVWIGNIRGNTWSRNHSELDPSGKEFWDFSFDEHATYDLTATVDYILKETGVAKIPYVGHSQGSAMAFAGMSSNPDLASKIEIVIGLGPIYYVHHTTSILMKFLAETGADRIIQVLGATEVLPSNEFTHLIGGAGCALLPGACNLILELICGPAKNIDPKHLDAYIYQTPAGTSTKNAIHWGQSVRTKRFARYDYGCGLLKCKNKEVYGTRQPPAYDISTFNVPTALFYGQEDALSDVKDVQFLLNNIPNLIYSKKLVNFGHMDFLWSGVASEVVYPDIFNLLDKYNVNRVDPSQETAVAFA